jgi:hypothetical protein
MKPLLNVMKKYSYFPFHSVLTATFPVISLMAMNSGQISLVYIARPLIISIIISAIILLAVNSIIRDWIKTGLIVSPIIIANSIFGILFGYIQNKSIFGFYLDHRFVLVIFLGSLLGVIAISVIKSKNNLKIFHQFFTIFGLVAVMVPTIQLIYFYISTFSTSSPIRNIENIDKSINKINSESPDIYYFILDGYTRSDRLNNTFNFDNTKFLQELGQLGFYVAKCSRSNYAHTRLSLASSLNMDYLSILAPELTPNIQTKVRVDELIQHNKVRYEFNRLGYKFVSFQTGYLFTEFHDADYYLDTSSIALNQLFITPFEKLLLNESSFTTLEIILPIKLWFESSSQSGYYLVDKNKIDMLYNLNLPSPKFVFIHLNPAHRPYVFTPNGEFQKDSSFYGKDNGWPLNQTVAKEGYINGIQFMDNALIPIIRKLQSTKNPPIIILQGDHGYMNFDQTEILNAYYFPDHDYQFLYPTISPVNSFRVIFNQFFNQTYPLLLDRSYKSQIAPYPFAIKEIKEKFTECFGD